MSRIFNKMFLENENKKYKQLIYIKYILTKG